MTSLALLDAASMKNIVNESIVFKEKYIAVNIYHYELMLDLPYFKEAFPMSYMLDGIQHIICMTLNLMLYNIVIYMLNNPKGLSISKANDLKILRFWQMHGRLRSRLATDVEDWNSKIDIWLESKDGQLMPIDTKYVDCSLSNVWHEVLDEDGDLIQRKCKKILYCFRKPYWFDGKCQQYSENSFSRCFFVDVMWLDKYAKENRKKWIDGKMSKKKLVYFNVFDAVESSAAIEIDLSRLDLH